MTIEVSQGFGPTLSLQVQEFEPLEHDVTIYQAVKDGKEFKLEMPSFALANVAQASLKLQIYVNDNLPSYLENFLGRSSSIVSETFRIAIRRARQQKVKQFHNL